MRKIGFLGLLFCFILISGQAKEVKLSSPDRNITLIVDCNDVITWSVQYKQKPVVDKATINIELKNNRNLGNHIERVNTSIQTIDQYIFPAIPNKDAKIHDFCNELTLTFKNEYKLVFRAYNDGVAYRFIDDMDKPQIVSSEQMSISFPEHTISYFPQEESMYSHNERLYLNKQLTSISDEEFCSLPVLFETSDKIKVLFTETALQNYPCMFLRGNGDNSVHAIFPHYVLETQPAKRGPDRNQLITKEADYIAEVEGKKVYPWRLFIITDDDSALVESNLSYQLANPAKLENASWIKPGKVAWDWYNANNIYGVDFKSGINTETYKYYIDFASANKIEYVILDEGWTKSTTEILESNPDIDLEELINYGKSKNVGIILWVLWKPLDENLQEILAKYSGWGAKGIKVDFMQRSDQYMVNSYEQIAKEAAKNHLMVDFHGAFKPAGLRRMYPNVVNYEGVRGNENNKWGDEITPKHTVTLPFIRMVAGPMDFTPGSMINANEKNFSICYDRPMTQGTRCHQVAMYVVYEAPLQMMCESPSTYYKEQETVDFIAQVPTVWDETKVLKAAVGEYIVVARKKGEKWYIGAMTDWSPREFEIDFSFLGQGDYQMEVMQDGINADRFAQDYKKTTETVSSNSKVKISMAAGGGWAAIISK